ncbi:hypothetical protein [Gilvimarinus chinensis]|uniref:hypothetical protein n=1 Tax=Gilvimarinus chinensis TaxID=396005 RepID=UPI0012FBCC35|nr:hypothetical protein [Gilvimarinus chinensis]
MKTPQLSVNGEIKNRKLIADSVFDVYSSSGPISVVAYVSVQLRAPGGGGGGAKTYFQEDGERGSAGQLVSSSIAITGATAVLPSGAVGGARETTTNPLTEGGDGSNASNATFAGLTANGGGGGEGGFDGSGFNRNAASVTNPDGSDAGRGGFGGDWDNASTALQSGQPGQNSRLFIQFLD